MKNQLHMGFLLSLSVVAMMLASACGNDLDTLLQGGDCGPGCKLAGADLSMERLTEANLARADMSRADLTDADLQSADLNGADLPEANSQAVYDLLRAERKRIATEIRAEGAERSQKITATAENLRKTYGGRLSLLDQADSALKEHL